MNIKIQDLTKVYPDGHKALNGLNLNIEPGMFGLLGPNGAGKTTLMRIMTLLQNPSSGTIFSMITIFCAIVRLFVLF